MSDSQQNTPQTPIATLVDFCRFISPRLNSIAFDGNLSDVDRYNQAGAVMDEFLALLTKTNAACANRADSAYIYGLVGALRARMSALTAIAAEPYDASEPNKADSKTNRWTRALCDLKPAWLPLDSLRGLAPGGQTDEWFPYNHERIQNYMGNDPQKYKGWLAKLAKRDARLRREATADDRDRFSNRRLQYVYNVRILYELIEAERR